MRLPRRSIKSAWLGVVILGVGLAGPVVTSRAAEADEFGELLLYEEAETWFVRAGPRALFNVKADIRANRPPVRTGRYDTGFVLPDASGPNSAQTWNWSYQDASQVSGDLLYQSRIENAPQAGLWNGESDVALGGEVTFGAELVRFELRGKMARLGLELGYAFNQFSVQERSRATGTASLRSDAYGTGGIVLPTAPYRGSFSGPGPLINLNPSLSSSIASASQTTFDGELESDLHTLRLGFWLEYSITEQWRLSGSLGYASIYADTDLRYTESFSFDDPRIADTGRRGKEIGGRDWRPGFYAQVMLQYPFNDQWFAYVGGDFQVNKDQEFRGEDREVALDFGAQFSVSGGVGFKF